MTLAIELVNAEMLFIGGLQLNLVFVVCITQQYPEDGSGILWG
jgi:hypothetical protein